MIHCENCNVEIGEGLPRCPSCLFPKPGPRQEAVPTPVKTADDPQAAPAEDAAKADDEPAEEPSTQGETAEEPAAGDKSGEAQPVEDKPAEDKAAEEVVDGQAVRVVEKIVIVEKAPTEPPVQEPIRQEGVHDAGKAVEEQG